MSGLRITLLMLTMATAGTCMAQKDDALGSWTSVTVKKHVSKPMSVALRAEYRTRDNMRETDTFFFRLTGAYKFSPYFSMATSYDFYTSHQTNGVKSGITLPAYDRYAHRGMLDLTGMFQSGHVNFSLRERYVYAAFMRRTVHGKDEWGQEATFVNPAQNTNTFRSLLTITYKPTNSKFSPYIAGEWFHSFKNFEELDRMKETQVHAFLGTNYKLNQQNSFKFYYVYQYKTPTGKAIHTLGLDYTINL